MKDIGQKLKLKREENGLAIEEVANDLKLRPNQISSIENGDKDDFNDVFEMKNIIREYAKYLGLDEEKLIDEFNEYLFEYTSKIPVEDIEKAMEEKQKEEVSEVKIVSPYTVSKKKYDSKLIIVLSIILAVLVLLVVVWSVKQITMDNKTTNIISYEK